MPNVSNRSGSQLETYLGPASEAQNQREKEMLPTGQSRKIGGGLERVFIPCTDFADEATVETITDSVLIMLFLSLHGRKPVLVVS